MKINWMFPTFRDEEEGYVGGGGGGAQDVFSSDTEEVEISTEGGGSGESTPSSTPSQQPAASVQQAPASIPIDQLPALMQAMQQGQQPQQQPRQLTQEEIDAKLKKVKITPEIAAVFFGEGATEPQIKMLQMFVDQIAEHTNTVNGYALHAMREQLNERYNPVLQHIEQQKTLAFTSALTEGYPALKGREGVISTVVQHLKQQGFVARDGQHAAQVVAAQVEQLIKQVDPAFTLAVQQQQNQPRQQTMPSMPGIPAGAGGQSSTGGQGGGGSKGPAWQDVFKR
jgi:hypothetical protein